MTKKKKNLISKLLVTIIPTVLISSTFLLMFISYRTSSLLKNEFNDQIKNKLDFAVNSYIQPLWEVNPEIIEDLNIALMKEKYITAINIYDSYGFLTGLLKEGQSLRLIHKEILTTELPCCKQISSFIFQKKTKIGKIEVFYTTQYLDDDIVKRVRDNIIVLALVSILIIIVIYFFLNKDIVNPLINLTNTTKLISDIPSLTTRVNEVYDGEIGILYNSFNKMLNRLEEKDKELVKIADLLKNIIESMNSMLITIDDSGKVLWWNSQATKETNVSENEIVGKNLWNSFSNIQTIKDIYDEMKLKSKIIYKHDIKLDFLQNDSEEKYSDIILFPIKSDTMVGTLIRIDDVTQLHQTDLQLKQAQKMEIIGTLSGGLAHDFNNVLSGIIGTSSIVNYKLKKGIKFTEKKLQEQMELIENSGRRAADIVGQLLVLSRKNEVSLVPLDVKYSINNVIKICQNSFPKNVSFQTDLNCPNRVIEADPTQIEQVLLNLCVNASHAMTIMKKDYETKGGIISISVLGFKPDDSFLKINSLTEVKDYCLIEIKDQGSGMSESTISKIFDPFYTTKREGKGTGLGLAVVKNIIASHKGLIKVESKIGEGTLFKLYFPLANKKVDTNTCDTEVEIKQGEGEILVIDDEKVIRETAFSLLSNCGYSVLLAKNGTEGLSIYRNKSKSVKLVILDIFMPGPGGKEIFDNLIKFDKTVNVLLSSGYKINEDIEEMLKNGAKGFLPKPYTITELSKAVDSILNN